MYMTELMLKIDDYLKVNYFHYDYDKNRHSNVVKPVENKMGNQIDEDVMFSLREYGSDDNDEIRFSLKEEQIDDYYDTEAIETTITKYMNGRAKNVFLSLTKGIRKTFVEQLLILIDQKELKPADVYKASNIDRRLYSKMINNKNYNPSMDTVIALVFGLKLNLEEANDLLSRAGYILSHSRKRDVIVEYFIKNGIYNLEELNSTLWDFHINPIGYKMSPWS